MNRYDSAFHDPPAPMALVTPKNPLNGLAIEQIPMLLDTGADVSVVPRDSLERLGLQTRTDTGFVVLAYDGSQRHPEVVDLELIFESHSFAGSYLVRDNSISVIGRNILNQLFPTLDGRNRSWNVEYR